MRTWATLILVAVLANSVSTYEVLSRPTAGAIGDSCPMMAHKTSAEPCIGEACACDRGSVSMVVSGLLQAVLRNSDAAELHALAARALSTADAHTAPGFLSPIDHPPGV
jgi:hypothetical protein